MVARRVRAVTGVTTYLDGYGLCTHYVDGRLVVLVANLSPIEAKVVTAASLAFLMEQANVPGDKSIDNVMASLLVEVEKPVTVEVEE